MVRRAGHPALGLCLDSFHVLSRGGDPAGFAEVSRAVVSAAAWESMFGDAELDLALRRIVHGDQRFTYVRPVRAGDRITASLTIDKVRLRAGSEILTCSVRVETAAGEEICTTSSTFFHSRGGAA